VDLNNDGYRDILSGSYSRMEKPMAGLFQVLWGRADGTFKQASVLNGTDQKPLIIPIKGEQEMVRNICTRPMAVDWDGDGDLDLVVGNFEGTFFLFTGEGKGNFAPKPEPIMAQGSPLKVEGAHSDPFVVDWDGDGDLDLLSGSSSGGVQWSENTSGKGKKPELSRFQRLIAAGRHVSPGQLLKEQDLTGPGSATRIWVDDVNNDGKLDLLVGDNVMLVSTAPGLGQADYEKQSTQWKQRLDEASKAMQQADAKQRGAASKRYQELYQERSKFGNEERTGFVWLYLQK
jgi:hypothetical protein